MSNIIRFPGLIDIHVHLRDPGETHKEDFYTGTCAALAGGVVTAFDMPNNKEPIFSYGKLVEKMKIAEKKAVCDWGLYIGTDGKNTDEFEKAAKIAVGLKVYMSLTTGKYVIGDEDLLDLVFRKWPKSKVLAVHAEENRVDLAIKLAARHKNKMHITHVSTKDSLKKIIKAKKSGLNISCDTAPQYLFLNIDYMEKLKGFGIVKPPLATKEDQKYLWDNLSYIDCIASDHAPHTIDEKQSSIPPAGIPGVETILLLLLTAVFKKRISIDDLIRLTRTNPQRIFGLKKDNDTFVEIDTDEKYIIENKNLFTKCGWSPFERWKVQGKVKRVFIRGTKVFENGKILTPPGFGNQVYSY